MTKVPRLINTFIPNHYTLSIDMSDAKNRRFQGTVSIKGTSTQNASSILLHSKNLTIISATIDGKSANFTVDEFDQISVTSDRFSVGDHIVTIVFEGKITDPMHGLYPCYYEHDRIKKELFATQFESHHAREVFPCVDEPEAKATFDVTLTTETEVTVLGNQPIKWQREENGKLVTNFSTTPRMSTYLLAWVVGELHKKTAATKRGVEVSTWATPAQPADSLDFGLDIAIRTIDFFEEYFGVDYPLPKSDHVALPDFSSGAMENWGLITYRESCLLADPKNTPESSKRSAATVIAHELSHQWFGNLVTMQWWNDLWLNESFANFMEYIAIDALEPSWNIWEEYATYEVSAALRQDSLDGVQSVKTDVNHPDEISALFDPSIVYAKGGRLLRMARQLIGDEAFRKGLKNYFEKFAYQNTVGDDLWLALEEASGQPMLELMNKWIAQPGLPLVSVEQESSKVTISQQRFFVGQHGDGASLWPIPLFGNHQELQTVLAKKSESFFVKGPVVLNKNLGAHFVTHYDTDNYQSLLGSVTSGELTALDKICLLQDTPLLARAGFVSSASLLPLAQAFRSETNEKVYTMAIAALNELRKFTDNQPEMKRQLKSVTKRLALPTHDLLGWDEVEGESDDDRERRSTALAMMVYGEDKATLDEAKRRFEKGLNTISPEIRSIAISTVVQHFETPDVVNQLFTAYKSTASSDLQIDIALGLTSTKFLDTAELILQRIKDPETIRPQDASRWFAYLVRNSDTRATSWNWLRNNWSWVKQTYDGDKSYDVFIRYAANALITRSELKQFKDFFTPMLDQPALSRTIELGIREIEGRVELIERDFEAVKGALQQAQ